MTVNPPRLRLVQLAGTPDPQAPKTRLPVAKTCWEGTFDSQRFEAQRKHVDAEFRRFEQSVLAAGDDDSPVR